MCIVQICKYFSCCDFNILYSHIQYMCFVLFYVCFYLKINMFRSWRIQILQFECGSPNLAPEGCLQYYTGIQVLYHISNCLMWESEVYLGSCVQLFPATTPPPHFGSYTRTLLVSQDRRHLFVTPWFRETEWESGDKGAWFSWRVHGNTWWLGLQRVHHCCCFQAIL